jgi:hypothetical protein
MKQLITAFALIVILDFTNVDAAPQAALTGIVETSGVFLLKEAIVGAIIAALLATWISSED